ncbi:MAG TPA: metallophosphoesterase [Candidatus Nanoarchaeia archaeon]|nr:metallophosphoesterase [Candidatus Nanoarchaeia archaeon]
MNFSYAHLSDLHLGSWRDPKMRDLSTQAFLTALDQCINYPVDFILFSGDIFNTSLPSLETLKIVTKKIKELQEKNIPLYLIAGSHDFSPSGKTMLDVLENAGLLKNVCKGSVNPETKKLQLKFTIDPKTQAKITGLIGRKGQLDRSYYENLDRDNLEQELGYKIFLFHTTLTELKPKHLEHIESQPASFLPRYFNYYAGGHIHHPALVNLPDYGPMTYPGALFPNNFSELEKYGHGGYYLIKVAEIDLESDGEEAETINYNQEITWIKLKVIDHLGLNLNCSHLNSSQIQQKISDYFQDKEVKDKLITIRLSGTLSQGKMSEINFKSIIEKLYQEGAYFILKNTSLLNSTEFEEIKIKYSNPETMEEDLIKEHLQQIKLFDIETELNLTKSLLIHLNTSKKEGETITDFNNRIQSEMDKLLNL